MFPWSSIPSTASAWPLTHFNVERVYWRSLSTAGDLGRAGLGQDRVLCKLLKALVDPNAAPVRALSREQRELMIAANNTATCSPSIISPGLPHLALRCSLPACHWRQLRPCGSSLPTLRLTFGPRSARSS